MTHDAGVENAGPAREIGLADLEGQIVEGVGERLHEVAGVEVDAGFLVWIQEGYVSISQALKNDSILLRIVLKNYLMLYHINSKAQLKAWKLALCT